MKKCKICDIIKEFNDFYKTGNYCKSCRKLYDYGNQKRKKLVYQKWYKENLELNLKRSSEYVIAHPEYYKQKNKEWYEKNKEKIKDKNAKRQADFRKRHIHIVRLRHIFHSFLRNKNKKDSTEKLLGYTFNNFKEKFPIINDSDHFDHKIPLTWFKDNSPCQIVNNLENLQLLEASENISKNNRFSHAVSKDFFDICKEYILEKRIDKIIIK